jgi:hypothetical protein
MLAEHIGTPNAGYSDMEWQTLGSRVDYLARQLQRHCEALKSSLNDIESAACRLRDGSAA